MPSSFELPPKRPEVVDLAVEDNLDGAILVRHRLVAGLEVDDLQAGVTQRAPARRRAVAGAPVGTPVPQRIRHGSDIVESRMPSTAEMDHPDDPAHRLAIHPRGTSDGLRHITRFVLPRRSGRWCRIWGQVTT